MSISPQALGVRIQTARQGRGLTQKQLADLAGIGKTAMFDLEHGNPGVRLNTLLAVLEVLDLSLRLAEDDLPAAAPSRPSPEPVPSAPAEVDSLPDRLL